MSSPAALVYSTADPWRQSGSAYQGHDGGTSHTARGGTNKGKEPDDDWIESLQPARGTTKDAIRPPCHSAKEEDDRETQARSQNRTARTEGRRVVFGPQMKSVIQLIKDAVPQPRLVPHCRVSTAFVKSKSCCLQELVCQAQRVSLRLMCACLRKRVSIS